MRLISFLQIHKYKNKKRFLQDATKDISRIFTFVFVVNLKHEY